MPTARLKEGLPVGQGRITTKEGIVRTVDRLLAGRHHVPSAIVAAISPGAVAAVAGPVDPTGVFVFFRQRASSPASYERT